jgi:hypothetical protein
MMEMGYKWSTTNNSENRDAFIHNSSVVSGQEYGKYETILHLKIDFVQVFSQSFEKKNETICIGGHQ